MKKLSIGLGAALLLLVAVVLVRTALYAAPPQPPEETQDRVADTGRGDRQLSRHLSQAIRFQTVSAQLGEAQTRQQYEQFIDWLAATYPQVHSALPPERLGKTPGQEYTLLFTWPGKNRELKPVLLSAHYDVVPVIPGTESEWEHPPYSGDIDTTHIWGRGALDDKSAAIGLMEAATRLLAEGFQPERTVYISLTHDEEIGGENGALAVVEKLKRDGVQLAWSLDEGSFLLDGFIPGIEQPVASINVAEKGYLTVDLIAHGKGGHSSMPPRETAVDILAGALVKLQKHPLPGGLEGLGADMFDAVAPHMPFGQRALFANRWLFGGLIDSALEDSPSTAAMLHTTVAPTMLSASIKENVLPIRAVATVNFRVHPRDSVDGIVEHLQTVIDDERVAIERHRHQPASRVSSSESAAFHTLAETARHTHGQAIVAPGLTIAGTDSRHYETVADDSYRFNPMVVTKQDISGFHGTNERISIDNMIKATRFYRQLINRGASQ